MRPVCGISGELKTFRNDFLQHKSSVSCFYDLDWSWEPGRVSELPERHCVWKLWLAVRTLTHQLSLLGLLAPGIVKHLGKALIQGEESREVGREKGKRIQGALMGRPLSTKH